MGRLKTGSYVGVPVNIIWHKGNQGTGSGLDADTLRTFVPNTGQTAGTIPVRDAEGKIPGNITGDAATVGGKSPSNFATSEQGTKADAALPASSYTATDVLSKVKSVDGTGSGLDADTLRGYTPTSFSPLSHNHDGVYDNYLNWKITINGSNSLSVTAGSTLNIINNDDLETSRSNNDFSFKPINGFKRPVKVASTVNILLSGVQDIDDIAVSTGDRVLVKNQATPAQNGIYIVSASDWIRADDFNSSIKIKHSALVPIEQGTINSGCIYKLTTAGAVIVGTTALNFALYKGPNSSNDTEIGPRTINQAIVTAYSNTGVLTQILSWFAKRFKEILGTTNWYDSPPTTLSAVNTHMGTDSTTAVKGHVQLATLAEVETGTNTTKAATPEGVHAKTIAAKAYTDAELLLHKKDYKTHAQKVDGITGGTSTAYTLDIPAWTDNEDFPRHGMQVTVKLHLTCGLNPTLKIGDWAAVPIVKQPLSSYSRPQAGEMIEDYYYTFLYDTGAAAWVIIETQSILTFRITGSLSNISWTGTTAPYTKTVTGLTGITADMSGGVIDLVPSSTWTTLVQQEESWSKIKKVDTGLNQLTFTAEEIPTVALPFIFVYSR